MGCDEVSKAQQLVKQAWLELHSKVAATADVEGGVEQQIAGKIFSPSPSDSNIAINILVSFL